MAKALLIEIIVRKDSTVSIYLTPKDGEEGVEALKKVIEQLKEAATPKGDPT